MPRVFISIGSNLDKERNVHSAITALERTYGPLDLSKIYVTEAQGFVGEPFYNLVAAFDTGTPAGEVAAKLADIEHHHGRRRDAERFGPRALDLDLLLYGDAVIHNDDIHVPRPDIRQYAFVLRPLAELAPELRHPETGQTLEEMWESFDGQRAVLSVIKFDDGKPRNY